MICEAIHCIDTASVRFAIYPDGLDGPRILAEVSEGALRDVFGACGRGDSLLQACGTHFDVIEGVALIHHRVDPLKPVKLETRDFVLSVASAEGPIRPTQTHR
ncbi:hypothetical protein AB4Z46_33895 [Variovorax sp. M-6]|uniref:hypothetical protein n=1 Tax=Variovorax sp. M-6 TaxID=3233041 RepID=UPI003F9D053B